MVIIIQKNANTSKLKPTPKTQNTWHNQYTNPQQQQKPTKKIAKKQHNNTNTNTTKNNTNKIIKIKRNIESLNLINFNISKLKPTPKTPNTWHNQYTNPQQQQKPTKKIAKKQHNNTNTNTTKKQHKQNNKNKKEILSIELI
ncbi:hypothetical protein [Methanobrevibacter arboriphilus]|uniref:hypothetical protein n=1 Tax=Methanobrevibacter arboriphilus TaxID=39441 RepID=UPI0005B2B152|nr:hypothetical protein [Methanobrevibacter arboriphilus]